MEVSTIDATNATTLSSVELYDDPIEHLKRIDVLDKVRGHAYQFWQKAGYTVVSVLPDAEGCGIPCIKLAKRLP